MKPVTGPRILAALCRRAEGGKLVLTHAELFDHPELLVRFTESEDGTTLTIEIDEGHP
jgi:hypothetical protein